MFESIKAIPSMCTSTVLESVTAFPSQIASYFRTKPADTRPINERFSEALVTSLQKSKLSDTHDLQLLLDRAVLVSCDLGSSGLTDCSNAFICLEVRATESSEKIPSVVVSGELDDSWASQQVSDTAMESFIRGEQASRGAGVLGSQLDKMVKIDAAKVEHDRSSTGSHVYTFLVPLTVA